MKRRVWVMALALWSAAGAGQAQAAGAQRDDVGARGGFLLQVDADFGGDRILTVDFEDGDSQDVRAGQGLALSIGGYFRPSAASRFEIDASLGYKFVTTAASNADIHVSRTVAQLGTRYRWPNGFYLAGGLVHHIDPKLNGDGFFEDVSFDDATGFGGEIGWRWIGLHFSNLEYSSPFYEDIDASSVGLRFTWRPGQRWF
jgi:hypothetical protein